jgi:hypothetical protein
MLETLPQPIAIVDASGRALAGNRAFRVIDRSMWGDGPLALKVFDEKGVLQDQPTDAPLTVVYPASVVHSLR